MRTAAEWVRLLLWGPIPKREKNVKRIQADALFYAAHKTGEAETYEEVQAARAALINEALRLRDESQ